MNGISWLVRLILDPGSRQKVVDEVGQTAKAAGAKMGAGGDAGAKAFVEKAKARFARDSAELREELYRGLVDKQEADRRGKQLAKEFNDAVLAEIKRRGDLGILTPKDFRGLSGSLKQAGLDGGAQFSSGFAGQMRKLSPVIRTILGGALVGFVVQSLRRISTEVGNAVRAAGEFQRVERGFASLNVKRGLSPVETLEALQAATHNTVDAMTLMRRSNLLLNSELPLTSQNIGELALLTRRLAEAQGMSAADGFDRAARGIAKLEPELLDELGITVKVEEATRKWAEANHRSVDSLTTAERQLAFYNAVVEDARAKVAGLGAEQVNAATRVDQLTTFWTNLKTATTLAVLESPRIEAFFNAIGVGASNAAGRVQELADKVGALIDSSAGSLGGTALGGLAGAAAGFVSPLPGGTIVGGLLGAFAGSGIGQAFDAGSGAPTFAEALARRQAATAEKMRLDELRGIQDINTALAKRSELTVQWTNLQAKGLRDTAEQKKILTEIAAVEAAIARLTAPKTKTGGGAPPPALTPGQLQSLNFASPTAGLAGDTDNIRNLRAYQAMLQQQRQGFLALGGTLDTVTVATPAGALSSAEVGERLSAFEKGYRSVLQNVTEFSQNAAYEIASAFQDTFDRMREEGATIGTFLGSIGRGIAGAFLAGLAQLAVGKVKENIARAIEEGAQALGFLALGNFPSHAAAAASAGEHLAAAAAWGALAGGAGAGRSAVTGGAGAIPPSTRDVGLSTAQHADPTAPVVNLFINPWDPTNPLMQRSVYAANEYARQRFGEGAKVSVQTLPAGAR